MLWFGTAALSAIACGVLARTIRRGDTARFDGKARAEALRAATPATKRAAGVTGHAGKWYVHLPLALATAGALLKEERTSAALVVVASSASARVAAELLDHLFFHRPPPPGRGDPRVQSFPSGHTLEPLAVALTSSVVLAREGLGTSRFVLPVAASALLSALSRLPLDRHWVSDLAGGALVGLAVSGTNLGIYELARDDA